MKRPRSTCLRIGFFLGLLLASNAYHPTAAFSATDLEWAEHRYEMVLEQIQSRGVRDPRVLAALRKVPRHQFVPESIRTLAYQDRPLPIGEGQTISQPYIVALMTELAQIQPGEKVLEIGTGSGYQAAVLAELTQQVYTIELLPGLARQAQLRLKALGYDRIQTRAGDGYAGWPEAAPFDAIVVTAAPDHVPQPLVGQLAEGGRLVIPVGPRGATQMLLRIRKQEGKLLREKILAVRFVPFLHDPEGL